MSEQNFLEQAKKMVAWFEFEWPEDDQCGDTQLLFASGEETKEELKKLLPEIRKDHPLVNPVKEIIRWFDEEDFLEDEEYITLGEDVYVNLLNAIKQIKEEKQ